MPGVGRPCAFSGSVIKAQVSVVLWDEFEGSSSDSSGVGGPNSIFRLEVVSVIYDDISVCLESGIVESVL